MGLMGLSGLTGVRSAAGLLAALAGALALVPLAARADEMLGPPPWRCGGRVAFTVDAVGRPDSAGYRLDTFVRIPPSTIAALETDNQGAGELRVIVDLRSAYGSRHQTAEQSIALVAADTSRGFGRVVALPFRTKPGTQKLKVRIEDAKSKKKGLAYTGRSAREACELTGEYELPGPGKQTRELSEPEFVWAIHDSGRAGAFQRGGRTVIPNPERLYGLLDSTLQVAFTARSNDSLRVWHWRATIADARGTVLEQSEGDGAEGRWLEATSAMDVGDLPAGGYDLQLAAWQEGDAQPLQRKARFGIAWEVGSWMRDASQAQDLVHFLLSAPDEDKFLALNPGEQERVLADLWARRDPTPGTPRNEFREDFLKRIATANARYTRASIGPGMYSDMGRVYIRYGEPSEVVREVIPAGDETLSQFIQQLQYSEGRDLGDVAQPGIGGDMRPFELWVYEGDIPLPPDADLNTNRNQRIRRLVFLFVDEHGLGDYRLRYSNE